MNTKALLRRQDRRRIHIELKGHARRHFIHILAAGTAAAGNGKFHVAIGNLQSFCYRNHPLTNASSEIDVVGQLIDVGRSNAGK